MLAFTSSENKQSQCFHLLGTSKSENVGVKLISNNTSLISNNTSILSSDIGDYCSFYSEPSEGTIMAFGESVESCGSIAMGGVESCGSIANSSSGSVSCGSSSSISCCC
ncbi:MAG: hypothetical protein MJ230_07480 [bacterium]|nr:hypothetical protein [bacterium]